MTVAFQSQAMLNAVFSALADPTRRRILERLKKGEATVGELAEPLEMSWPAVTKHLRVLEETGLLDRRVEGRTHHLTLNAAPMAQASKWLEEHRQFWEKSLDGLVAYLEDGEGKSPPRKKKRKTTKKKKKR